ncbi:KWG Leptospira [Methylophaga muralis]|uniref:KWG Leptospira n=3 Tax=Methylophaga TaxID=40222 RepID=A0A1E3GS96_9GAMM|nr:KWG Leptospira [Methylophaga muralis]
MEIEPLFAWAYSFSDGLAVITHNYRQYGFINRQGEVVIEPQFEHAHPFKEGLAAIMIRDKWGYISKD